MVDKSGEHDAAMLSIPHYQFICEETFGLENHEQFWRKLGLLRVEVFILNLSQTKLLKNTPKHTELSFVKSLYLLFCF